MGLFKKKPKKIIWKDDGWTVIQDPDAVKHVLGITCRTEDSKIVEIIIRHNDGEAAPGRATVDGKNILPISVQEFDKLYMEGKVEIR